MPRRKTKLLVGNYLQNRLDEIERRVRAQMRKSNEPAPKDLRRDLSVLVMCHDFPVEVLDSCPASQKTRLELATFVIKHPEHAVAALRAVYRKPKIDASPSAVVREFLLTRIRVDTPGATTRIASSATDGEIATAAETYWRITTGRPVKISKEVVKGERRRLESKYGMPISVFLDAWTFLASAMYPRLIPRRRRR